MRRATRRRLRSALTVCAMGIGLCFAPIASRAETFKGLELERRMREATWHWGPFYIQPQFVLSNVGVDSNVYYSPNNPVKDFTLTAGPAATVYVPIHRKFVLSAYGSPQYVWYSKTATERTWNYYFNGAAQLNLKNVFLSLEGLYTDARERWSPELDILARRKEIGYGGSALVKLAWKTSVSLAYRTVRYDYESQVVEGGFDIRVKQNRTEDYGTLSLFYQASSQNRIFFDFEYGRYNFEFAEQAAISDSQSAGTYAGFEFSPFGRRIRGRIRLGYKVFDVRNQAFPDYKGLVGDTQVTLRLNKPLAFRASYVRDVRFSVWYDNPYYIENKPGVGVSLYPVRFLRFDYDYSRGKNTYPVAGGGTAGEKRFDIYTIHSTGVYFRIQKNTALGVIASWWARDSNIDSEDDKRTFFGLNLTYDF